jgi:hypothetical protein
MSVGAAPIAQDGVVSSAHPSDRPVIVLTYSHTGGYHLNQLLSGSSELACTSSTGVLQLCQQAAGAWQSAEGRGAGVLSPLAATTIRRFTSTLITVILARAGGRRWCETAIAQYEAADTFLKVYPGAQFLCLHRSCPDVIYAALRATPWGLSNPLLAPFTATYPGSTVAAIAAYWVGFAGLLLGFEESHPEACLRIRYEDLFRGQDETADQVEEFLGLGLSKIGRMPSLPGNDSTKQGQPSADIPGCGDGVPVEQIAAPLLAQVNELQKKLGYPPLEQAS